MIAIENLANGMPVLQILVSVCFYTCPLYVIISLIFPQGKVRPKVSQKVSSEQE